VPAEVVAVRLCGLHRKPRVRDYAAFVTWAAGVPPDASTSAAAALQHWAEGGATKVRIVRDREREREGREPSSAF
jgi:hypothetical protein